MYIITARRMTSGELLKYRKGLFITADYESLFPGSSRSRFTLTVPVQLLARLGGWLGRTRDPPGAQLLWHCHAQLTFMTIGFQLRDEYG